MLKPVSACLQSNMKKWMNKPLKISSTLPETNSKFAPENGWLEYFLLSFLDGLFSGANLLLVLGSVRHHQPSTWLLPFFQFIPGFIHPFRHPWMAIWPSWSNWDGNKKTCREDVTLDDHPVKRYIRLFPKIGVPPNHPFVHRVFHYFHHPFWGSNPPIFGSTSIPTLVRY